MGAVSNQTEDAGVSADDIQVVNLELRRLLEKRANKLPKIAPSIAAIHNKTERVEKDLVAGEKEFYTKRGKYFPKGDLYHVHYTKDLNVYYMSGGEHNPRTEIIFRTNLEDDDFQHYNTLNKQETIILKSTVTPPTEEDYKGNQITRYFAKKANEDSSPVFEISEDDFETSPLYIYVSLTWYIKGTKSRVLGLNRHEVKVASKTIPNIGKLLPDYQYYRSNKKLGTVDEIRARLGILTDESTAGETTTTSTTTTTTTTTTGTATTAPPAGGMAGGTGGTGGGSY